MHKCKPDSRSRQQDQLELNPSILLTALLLVIIMSKYDKNTLVLASFTLKDFLEIFDPPTSIQQEHEILEHANIFMLS